MKIYSNQQSDEQLLVDLIGKDTWVRAVIKYNNGDYIEDYIRPIGKFYDRLEYNTISPDFLQKYDPDDFSSEMWLANKLDPAVTDIAGWINYSLEHDYSNFPSNIQLVKPLDMLGTDDIIAIVKEWYGDIKCQLDNLPDNIAE